MTEENDEQYKNDMIGMNFKTKKIQFFPEDLAKMETMTDEEKIDFAIKLRQDKRYTIIYD